MSGFNRGDSGREVRLLFLKIHVQKKKKKHLEMMVAQNTVRWCSREIEKYKILDICLLVSCL